MIIAISSAVLATILLAELRSRFIYKIRWVCLCGHPSARTVYWTWSGMRAGSNNYGRPSDSHVERKPGRIGLEPIKAYAVRMERGRPRYETCPRCGRMAEDAARFSTKLYGIPGRRRARITPHQIEEYHEFLMPPEPVEEEPTTALMKVEEASKTVHPEVIGRSEKSYRPYKPSARSKHFE